MSSDYFPADMRRHSNRHAAVIAGGTRVRRFCARSSTHEIFHLGADMAARL